MPKTKKSKKSSPVKRTVSKKTTKKQVKKSQNNMRFILGIVLAVLIVLAGLAVYKHHQDQTLSSFRAEPFNIVKPLAIPNAQPLTLYSPANVKTIYNLPKTNSGVGTIAIIDAYDDPNIQSDLATFDAQYNIPACTTANGCLQKYNMSSISSVVPSWAIEEALDVEWAHAIAPTAKIVLVEARSDNGVDLINAINYARSRSDVVSVSMSWGGNEFSAETGYESDFISRYGAQFFAASGDSGHGTSWPAVSANVIGVGGTTVSLNSNGTLASESAWSGSGGGTSSYITEPAWQKSAGILHTNNFRATPDVSYNANPSTGYPVYNSILYNGYKGWFQVGGTSAGTPQWAAIDTLSGHTLAAPTLYKDTKTANTKIRDIITGTNGSCLYYCTAGTGYDYVTGLGSPLSTVF